MNFWFKRIKSSEAPLKSAFDLGWLNIWQAVNSIPWLQEMLCLLCPIFSLLLFSFLILLPSLEWIFSCPGKLHSFALFLIALVQPTHPRVWQSNKISRATWKLFKESILQKNSLAWNFEDIGSPRDGSWEFGTQAVGKHQKQKGLWNLITRTSCVVWVC